MTKQVHIDGRLEWRVFEDRQTNTWIGVCEAIGQTALGDTFNDLVHHAIRNVMDELFYDLVLTNEFESFLRHHGWRLQQPMPQLADDERYEFDVPFYLLEAEANGGGTRVSR